MGYGVCDCDGRVGGDEMYRGSAEPMLNSLSNSYSEEDRISQ